jgi:hypothetical protein
VRAPPAPTPAARAFAALLVARAAFGMAYLGVTMARWPVPWYLPLEHRWEVAAHPAGVAMGWFGTTGAALGAATLAAAGTWVASARGPLSRALGRTVIVLAIARAGALVLAVDFAYFGWTLTHTTPSPVTVCPEVPGR